MSCDSKPTMQGANPCLGTMKIERKWAMPNKWTFLIKPIRVLLEEEMGSGMFLRGTWCDPFAGRHSPAQVTNDLNHAMPAKHHLEAHEFLRSQNNEQYDGVLFDPPYSQRQVSELYQSIGKEVLVEHTRMSFWSEAKNEVVRIVKPGGKVICCGWNSMGLGKNRGFAMKRVLLVPHGGSRNDTIVTVEIKK